MFYYISSTHIINPSQVVSVWINKDPEEEPTTYIYYTLTNGDIETVKFENLEEAEENLEEFVNFTLKINH